VAERPDQKTGGEKSGRTKKRRVQKKPGARRGTPRRSSQRAAGASPAARKKVVRLPSGTRYRTKNRLAQAMVWKLVRRGLPVRYVLFDNWYAAQCNFRLWERLGLLWVTRGKSNLKVEYQGQKLTARLCQMLWK
jgi:hypothetical protein